MSEMLLFPAAVILANVVILSGMLSYFFYCKMKKCDTQ
jgi:hypothetical protein